MRKDGEVFDPVKREWAQWAPLGAAMAHYHATISTVAMAGGLIAVGGHKAPEVYDEDSGRWLTLPHAMVQPCKGAGLVSVPAAALTAATGFQWLVDIFGGAATAERRIAS
jgi:hypothetical protein